MLFIKARRLLCLLLLSVFTGFTGLYAQKEPNPSDPYATRRTAALFYNLRAVANAHTLFGHQDDLAYGVFWKRELGRSDVQETCGSYPAVFGWDLGRQFGEGRRYNIDSVRYQDIHRLIRWAYGMGSVNTLTWHLDNLVSGGSAWDTTVAVRHLLPGGKDHARLLTQLDGLAVFFKSLRAGSIVKHPIPIIFRPWHEHTGHWFWWGSASCTPEEYKQLFRFTVDYLRQEKGVHNVLYAYSPDFFVDSAQYMLNYPGDDYVDIFGLDYYYRPENLDNLPLDLPCKLDIIGQLAAEHGKIAAFTETGFEAIPNENWWTQMLLSQLNAATSEVGIAYVMLWRNAFHRSKSGHYYVPFPGQQSARDFVQFSRNERMLFQDKLPKLYQKPKNKKRKPAR